MSDVSNSKRRWDNTAAKYWRENLRPPWRPSRGDVENYKRGILMAKKPIKNILILGATPELRVLANQLGERIWLADRSLKMIREMAKLTPLINFEKERYLISDWCALKKPGKISFDIILGDLALRLIRSQKQFIFLRKISHLLFPQGLFITRAHFVKESLVKLPTEKIINKSFSLLDPNIPGRGTDVKNLLISRILDKNSFSGSINEIRRKSRLDIKNYLAINPGISPNQKQILKGVLNRFEKRRLAEFFPQTKKEIERSLKICFLIKKQFIANDYGDSKYSPVYVLRSNKKLIKNS